MQKGILPSILAGLLFMGLAFSGCKKVNQLGIDNNQVIKVPYTLYAGDSSGVIINTNDGRTFHQMFPPDGVPPKALLIAGKNLLMVKNDLHLSKNGGKDFNPVFTHVKSSPWQNMIYNDKTQHRVYLTTTLWRGIVYSDDYGETWTLDSAWVGVDSLPQTFSISSFSGLEDGNLFAFSNIGNILFIKPTGDPRWRPVEIEGAFPVNPAAYYLTSNDNTLFLVDYDGRGGAWYSQDDGQHWTKFGQGELPANVTYYDAISPGGTTLLVGTDTSGIYKSGNGRFTSASGGLESNMSAYSFTKKKNYYKNDKVKSYIYVGTNEGLYRSENNGRTWYLITPNIWRQAYVSIN